MSVAPSVSRQVLADPTAAYLCGAVVSRHNCNECDTVSARVEDVAGVTVAEVIHQPFGGYAVLGQDVVEDGVGWRSVVGSVKRFPD